jgi:hypothetical protein
MHLRSVLSKITAPNAQAPVRSTVCISIRPVIKECILVLMSGQEDHLGQEEVHAHAPFRPGDDEAASLMPGEAVVLLAGCGRF